MRGLASVSLLARCFLVLRADPSMFRHIPDGVGAMVAAELERLPAVEELRLHVDDAYLVRHAQRDIFGRLLSEDVRAVSQTALLQPLPAIPWDLGRRSHFSASAAAAATAGRPQDLIVLLGKPLQLSGEPFEQQILRHPQAVRAAVKKMHKRLQCGFPHSLRAVMWAALLHVGEVRARLERERGEGYEGLLREALQQMREGGAVAEMLSKDLPRVPSGHHSTHGRSLVFQYRARRPLRNALLAYAVYDPEVGYSSGMGCMLADLMAVMSPTQPSAEQLFLSLVRLMDPPPHGLGHRISFVHLRMRADMALLSELMRRLLPKLAAHFEAEGLTPEMCFYRWIACMYSDGQWPAELNRPIRDRMLLSPSPRATAHSFVISALFLFESRLLLMDFLSIMSFITRTYSRDYINITYAIIEERLATLFFTKALHFEPKIIKIQRQFQDAR